MSGSVNMPGVLAIGDLKTTTSVRIGRGAPIIVDNSGTAAVGQVTVVGSLSPTSLDAGTSPVTCGALSAGSITVGGGVISVVGGLSPAISLGGSSGFDRSGNTLRFYYPNFTNVTVGSSAVLLPISLRMNGNSLTCGGMTCSTLTAGSITAAGAINCGANALTCGALTSGSITSSGSFSCGASALTCGALSCTSVASAGGITQPQYSLRTTKTTNQVVGTDAVTAVVWDAVETTNGGASNWPFTSGSLYTCPASGRYCITNLVVVLLATGTCGTWVEINPPGGVPGSARRYAEASLTATGGGTSWICGGSVTYQLSAGDTVLAAVLQTSGSNLNVGLSGTQQSEFSIVRLSE